MLKILQARLQQYVNCELPDVQVGFRKGRGTRDQIVNVRSQSLSPGHAQEEEREAVPLEGGGSKAVDTRNPPQ